jgi:Glycosyl transferase family 11
MIIVKIYGGMANQLFQYAAGYALALHHTVPLKIDIRYFQENNNDTKRSFALDQFSIDYEIASQEEIDQVFKFRFIDYAWNKILPFSKKKFYGEKKPGFNESFFDLPGNIYLRGYFQSELYFINCKQSLLEQFILKTAQFPQLKSLAATMSNSQAVALHIRLGDYLNPTLSSIMAPFDLHYYKKAIEYFQQNLIHPTFYVFSDEIQFAKELLKVEADFIFVDAQMTKNATEDFYLMQSCQHQIIANSTFSWWAAYLNQNVNKIVVAPQKWYKAHFGDATHLYPKNWIVIG